MLKKIGLVLISCCVYTTTMAANRFIIKYKPTEPQARLLAKGGKSAKTARAQMIQPLSRSKLAKLSNISGSHVTELHAIATGAHVIILDKDLNPEQTQELIKNIEQDSNIAYIEEDRLLKPTAAPVINPNWQWDMDTLGFFPLEPSWDGDDFVAAWSILGTAGYVPGNGIVVAVIDTGYTPHPNFINALQTLNGQAGVYGYQFISDCRLSGQCAPSTPTAEASHYAYEPNGLDLGDFVSQADRANPFFSGCAPTVSTWHGSHVTGIIAANGYTADNESYIAGGAYGAMIVPVRALGKCGGYDSDILNGMLWASGFDVPSTNIGLLASSDGVGTIPGSPNPAQVINMSLGSNGSCNNTQQEAIDQVTANGTVVVVAAGNSSRNIVYENPANCKNVIVVAAKGPTNSLASYSNYGATTVTASGGDRAISGCSASNQSCASSIYSTIWSSTTTYQPPESGGFGIWATYEGTSMASPHVAALVADMIGVFKAKNESYSTFGIADILQKTAKSYTNCSVYGCAGSGALDAAAAIKYALESTPVPPPPPPTPVPVASAGGGGGCSAISNGNDFSLILLLLGSALYTYQRKKLKICNVKPGKGGN